MSTTLALIHTSSVLVPSFASLCAKYLPGTPVFHIVDESLIKNTIAAGSLQKSTMLRLVNQIDSAARAGAGVVLVTCSSIGEGVTVARRLFDIPVLRIDEPMAELAVQTGQRIGVLATLQTTLAPTVRLLEETATEAGYRREVVACLCEGAFDAVLAGDVATHDQLVGQKLADLSRSVDVVVLAQASMARVVAELPPESRSVPILSSPESALARAAEIMAEGRHGDESGPGESVGRTCS